MKTPSQIIEEAYRETNTIREQIRQLQKQIAKIENNIDEQILENYVAFIVWLDYNEIPTKYSDKVKELGGEIHSIQINMMQFQHTVYIPKANQEEYELFVLEMNLETDENDDEFQSCQPSIRIVNTKTK